MAKARRRHMMRQRTALQMLYNLGFDNTMFDEADQTTGEF
jgi:hypothetical protein